MRATPRSNAAGMVFVASGVIYLLAVDEANGNFSAAGVNRHVRKSHAASIQLRYNRHGMLPQTIFLLSISGDAYS